MKDYVCTFPDRSKVFVTLGKQNNDTVEIQWTSALGLLSTVWVPLAWVTQRHHTPKTN